MEDIKEKEVCACDVECKHHENSEKCECHNEEKHSKKEKKEKKNKYKEEIKKLEEIVVDFENKLKYSQAELINYRKRKEEETTNLLKYANQDLILELLPILDNFERAIKLDDNDLTDELSKFLEGFKMMYSMLNDILKNYGVEEINPVGEKFDPNTSQALMTDTVEDMEDDDVIEVLLKGYKLKGRVIRPASVKINKKGEMKNE